MGDVDGTKSEPDEPEAATRERRSVAYPLDWATDRLKEITSFYETFEEVAKTMGYVSPKAVRERQRRRERRQTKQLADALARAIWLAILYQRSRGSQNKSFPLDKNTSVPLKLKDFSSTPPKRGNHPRRIFLTSASFPVTLAPFSVRE